MLTLNNPLIGLSSIPCTLAKSSYSPEVFASEKHQADNIAVSLNINNENTVSKSTSLLEEMNVEPDHIEVHILQKLER